MESNAAVTIYFEDLASDLIDEIEKQQKGKKKNGRHA